MPGPGYDADRAAAANAPVDYRYGSDHIDPRYSNNMMPQQPLAQGYGQPVNGYGRPAYGDAPAQYGAMPRQDAAPQYDNPASRYDAHPRYEAPAQYNAQAQYGAPTQYEAAPQYGPAPQQSAMRAPADEERYCPECDAPLPAGATECPVCHTRIETQTIEVVEGICPDCGTEVAPSQKFCHNCGARLEAFIGVTANIGGPGQPAPDATQSDPIKESPAETAAPETGDEVDDTVAGGPLAEQVPECKLQMLNADGTEANGNAVVCVGNEVDLYRGNTDPANNTIARDVQARLTYADGKWSIEDCSALHTTYIRPSRKIELREGDVIVMGNRQFMFKP